MFVINSPEKGREYDYVVKQITPFISSCDYVVEQIPDWHCRLLPASVAAGGVSAVVYWKYYNMENPTIPTPKHILVWKENSSLCDDITYRFYQRFYFPKGIKKLLESGNYNQVLDEDTFSLYSLK